jgi:hypothetical protein
MTEPVISDYALSLFDECVVTAFRKRGDTPESTKVWRNLNRMTREEREAVWYFALSYFKGDGYLVAADPEHPHFLNILKKEK